MVISAPTIRVTDRLTEAISLSEGLITQIISEVITFTDKALVPGILPWRTGRKAFQQVAAPQLRAVMLMAVGATASLKKLETWVEESRRGCV